MFFLYLVCAASGYGWWWSHKKIEAYNKYEFENRSTGGVVGFKTYEEGKKHDFWKERLGWLRKGCMGIAMLSLSIILTVGMRS